MATKTFKVALSLDNPRLIQSGIDVRSFDKQSIKIAIELTKNSQVYQIPIGATIRISLLKLARQEQKIIVDVPNNNRDSIDWIVPDYLDGYQGTVRVGVYLVSGTENVDLGYFTILSNVSDIDKMADEFTDNVFQGWEQIEADLNELNLTIAQANLDLADDLSQIDSTIANINAKNTQVDTLASDFTADVATKQSDVTSKYNAFDTSVTQANQTIDDILALQPQFQSVLDETTDKDVISAPEIILARGGAQTLGERLDSEKAEVTTQLAQTIEGQPTQFYIPSDAPTKAYVTFVDDDATKSVLEKLLPIFEQKNVPMVVAANIDNQNIPEPFMTPTDLKMLQDDYGWEIANHGYTHVRLDQVSGEELRHEIVDAHNELVSYGLKVENIVYPFGAISSEGQVLASNYYKSGYVAGGGAVRLPLKNSFGINRVPLGSFGNANEMNYEFYKSKVDEAISNNGWTIFMTHCWNENHDSTQQQHLSDIIDYCLANNVEIVTLRDGYKVFGNKFEFRDRLILNNQGELVNLVPSTEYKIISDNTINIDTPTTYFKPYTETITKIHSALGNTAGFPITNGLLRTLLPGFNGGVNYVTQILTGFGGGMYYRVRKTTSSWTDWLIIGQRIPIVATTDTEIVLPGNGYKAFNVTVSPLNITATTPFIVTPKTFMNTEIVYSAKRNTDSAVTITLHNLTATERNLGIMEWVVKVLE